QHIRGIFVTLQAFLFLFFLGTAALIRKIADFLGAGIEFAQFLLRVGLAAHGLGGGVPNFRRLTHKALGITVDLPSELGPELIGRKNVPASIKETHVRPETLL